MPQTSMFQRSRVFARFLHNTGGVASVEFAFLIPLLMLMAFGTFEVGRGVVVHKRLQRATDMIADLVAREQQIGKNATEAKDAMTGIMRAAEHSMFPYSKLPLKMAIMSVRASTTSATNTTVEWTVKYNGMSAASCPAPKTLPQTGMVEKGNAVVLVESEYAYTPLLNNIIPGLVKPMTFKDTMVYAPRNSCVDMAGQNCVAGCGPTITVP